VFCPKYRRSVLINGIDSRLKELLYLKTVELKVVIKEMEVMPDHVHLLIEIPPTVAIGTVVGRLKGYTSKILRSEYQHLRKKLPSMWTNSYFVSSVGGVTLKTLKQYIESQKNK